MPGYNLFPAVDAEFNFPPEIQKSIRDNILPEVLDVATSDSTPETLVKRDSDGNSTFSSILLDGPLSLDLRQAASIGYVDNKLNPSWIKLGLASGWKDYDGGGFYKGGVYARRFGDNLQLQIMTTIITAGRLSICTLPTDLIPEYSSMHPAITQAASAGLQIRGSSVTDTPGLVTILFGQSAAGTYYSANLTVPLT